MKTVAREVCVVAVCAIIGFAVAYSVAPRHGTVKIDCTIAEISPDIPVEAREQCRKLRMDNIK